MKRSVWFSLALGSLAVPQGASAAIVTYTDQTAFLAAIAAPGTDTFNDLGLAFASGPLNRSAGGYGYTTQVSGGFTPAGTLADPWLSATDVNVPIAFTGFTGGVYGVGGFFFTVDVAGLASSGDITLNLDSGALSLSRTITGSGTGSFFGFVSDDPLSQLTVSAVAPTSGYLWPAINNLTLGGAAVAAVPEPATWALMIAGLGVIAAGLRRRPRTARAGERAGTVST